MMGQFTSKKQNKTKQNPRQSAEELLELIQELTKMIEHKSNR